MALDGARWRSMAAMVGLLAESRVNPSGPAGRYSRPSNDSSAVTLAPAQNACPPAPVGRSSVPKDYLCFMFLVDGYSGVSYEENEEGTLKWVRRRDLASLPMWPSDHEWIPLVFDNDPRQFHGIMPFHNGQMVSWSYHRI